MRKPSLILFDLGGVLIELAIFSRLAVLVPQAGEVALLRRKWLESTAVAAFERGGIGREEFARRFLAEWHLPLSPAEFLAEFRDWPRAFFPDACELVGELRRSYRVGCLSNCNEVHWEKFDGFRGLFDLALSSHHLGAVKPAPEAFRLALAAAGVPPEEILFFDDNQVNVDAARQLGWQAHCVEGVPAIRRVLGELGIGA
jgi:putative hydrolase of the HAD superfamily